MAESSANVNTTASTVEAPKYTTELVQEMHDYLYQLLTSAWRKFYPEEVLVREFRESTYGYRDAFGSEEERIEFADRHQAKERGDMWDTMVLIVELIDQILGECGTSVELGPMMLKLEDLRMLTCRSVGPRFLD